MIRRPPRSTRTDTLFPYPTLFRSRLRGRVVGDRADEPRVPARCGALDPDPDARGGTGLDPRGLALRGGRRDARENDDYVDRSEEHTSELQSLMRISSAVFCLKKKTNNTA